MKKIILILLFIGLSCSISGCTNVSGLDEQLIINSIGVDKNENVYELTIQFLNIDNSSQEEIEGASTTLSMTTTGDTLLEALNNVQNQTGKKLLYSHALILVIGNDTAKMGINNIIDFFATNHKLRPTVEVLISNTSAKNLLSAEINDKLINAEDILSISNTFKNGYNGMNSNIRYILKDSKSNLNQDIKIWYIELDENSTIYCKKIAIFKDYKLTYVLNEDETKGLFLILGHTKNISDKIIIDDKTVSYYINNVKSNISVKIENEVPIFNIDINVQADIYDIENSKTSVNERLMDLINNTIDICVRKYKCDILNFNKYIMNYDSNYYKSNENNIENILCQARFNIKPNVKVKNMGPNQKISNLVY